MQKKVLITGAAGYTGAVVARSLLESGYTVVGLDSLMYGGDSLLGIWSSRDFSFVHGDVTSRDDLEKVFSKHQFFSIVHLAGIVGDPACAKNPERSEEVNLGGPLLLLDFAKKHKIPKFVFASTCSNYGKMDDSSLYVDENSNLSPVSLYAKQKVSFEEALLKKENIDYDFCPTVLRFSTIYGVAPRMRFDLTVNEFAKDLALGREIQVFGEQFWRPYLHVSDYARSIKLILEKEDKEVAWEVFNVGDTNENYTKQMIVDEIKKCIPDAKVEYVHRNEDPRDYRVSFEKIRSKLGFKISKTVPDGIREVCSLIQSGILHDPDDQKYKNS